MRPASMVIHGAPERTFCRTGLKVILDAVESLKTAD